MRSALWLLAAVFPVFASPALGAADLSVEIALERTDILVGENVRLTATFRNAGPDPADVWGTDQLSSSNAILAPVKPLTQSEGVATPPGSTLGCLFVTAVSRIQCFGGNLPAGQSASVVSTFTAVSAGTVTVTAQAGHSGDANTANNSATAQVTVRAAPPPSCPPDCPPPPPAEWQLTAARAAVRYLGPRGTAAGAAVAKGRIIVRGRSDRPARARLELRRIRPIRRASEKRAHARPVARQRVSFRITKAGDFTRTIRVKPGTYPGRYTLTLREIGTPPGGAQRLPARSRALTVKPPRSGVVQKAFIGRSVGGRPVTVFTQRPVIIFANFRFWSRPTRGQATRVAWYFNGRPVPPVRPANFLGLAANGRLVSTTGILPQGRYRVDLRVGRKVVARATTRVR